MPDDRPRRKRLALASPWLAIPWRAALLVASPYLVLGTAYIVWSTNFAAETSASVEQLRRLELRKGLAFVAASALLLFTLAFALARRLAGHRERLLEARDALSAADRQALTGLLAASVAHDFANVLTSISGAAQLLAEDGTLTQAAQRRLQTIRAGVDRGVDLARRLGRVGKGAAAGELAELDVAAVARDTAELLQSHPSVRRAQVRVVSGSGGPVPLRGHQVLVVQIVSNLIVNAAEAKPRAQIAVLVMPAGDGCRISVHDDGPGIDPALARRALEAFFTTKSTGTGLGLVSVRACAEVHRGAVAIGNSPLGGATVEVVLRHVDPGESASADGSAGGGGVRALSFEA